MRATALLAILGALALAGPGNAAERVATFPANGLYPVAGPVPIGGEVAYGYRFGAGRWWLGTTKGTLAVLPEPSVARRVDVFLAASPVRAAWVRTLEGDYGGRIQDPPVEDGLFSVRSPGWPQRVDNCDPADPCRRYGTAYRFAVDGSTLAWLREDFPNRSTLTIDRGDGSEPHRMEITDPAGPVAAAGGRVAFADTDSRAGSGGPRVTVIDGRELLRIDSSPTLTFADNHWVLQPDGKVVIWSRQGLVWFSPQEPYAHPLPTPPDRWFALVGAAGDRLAYLDSVPDSYVSRLRILDFGGATRTIASFPGSSSQSRPSFDGTMLAWSALRCGMVGVWTASATGGGAPWRDYTGSCPAFDGRRPQAGRDRVVVRLICPRGCRGSVSVALRDAAGKRLTRKRVAFRARPRARIVRLPLDAGDARALRKAGRSAPPVVIQRFSGRDGTGAPVVVRRQRYVRSA